MACLDRGWGGHSGFRVNAVVGGGRRGVGGGGWRWCACRTGHSAAVDVSHAEHLTALILVVVLDDD